MHRKIIFLFTLILILSCNTTNQTSKLSMEDRNASAISSIKDSIKDNPQKALALIDAEKFLGYFEDKTQLEMLSVKAQDRIYELYTEADKKNEYEKALNLLSDLNQLKYAKYGKNDKPTILSKLINKYYDTNKALAQYYTDLLIQHLSQDDSFSLSPDLDSKIQNLALDFNSHGGSQDGKFKPHLALRGTVTVIVDSGTILKNGMIISDGGLGSGFFISRDGYIITNYHVIEDMLDSSKKTKLYIKSDLTLNQRLEVKLISYDPILDIALLKAPILTDVYFLLDNDKEIKEGTDVFVIGTPVGLSETVTRGIVSSVSRQSQIGYMYQIDAPVNHGNSGGPVFSSEGRLIAIAFAGIEQFEGLNFAIPSYLVKNILPKLFYQEKKDVPQIVYHPILGLELYPDGNDLLTLYKHPKSLLPNIKYKSKLKSIAQSDVKTIKDAQNIVRSFSPDSLITLNLDGKTYISQLMKMSPCPLCNVFENFNEDVFSVFFGFKVNKLGNGLYSVSEVLEGSIAQEENLYLGDIFAVKVYKLNKAKNYIQLIVVSKNKMGTYFPKPMMFVSQVNIPNLI